MKVLIYTDPHWCQHSSIIRSYGKKHSTRLENLINSINWCERLAEKEGCTEIICAGDFFDRTDIVAREATALKDIEWANMPHMMLVGNHEADDQALTFLSLDVFDNPNFKIIRTPWHEFIEGSKTVITYIPFLTEEIRKPFKDYLYKDAAKQIVISHNELKGIQYGPAVSKYGFELEDLESVDLFINGHIHNGSFLNKRKTALNLGNLTGKSFEEDAKTYTHNVIILDTETLEMRFIENPYAFNFYKFDIDVEADINKLNIIKNNAVLSIRCEQSLLPILKQHLVVLKDRIIESRTVAYRTIKATDGEEETTTLATTDHIALFEKFAMEQIEDKVITKEELGILRTLGGTD